MKKDLKNVILTFGLIALVLTQGSLFYQNKAKAESTLLTQEKIKSAETLKKQQTLLAAKLEREQLLLDQKIADAQVAAQKIQIKNASDQATYNLAQADIAQKQAQLLAKKQAQALADQKAAQALADKQALAQAQQVQTSSSPSRRSAAS